MRQSQCTIAEENSGYVTQLYCQAFVVFSLHGLEIYASHECCYIEYFPGCGLQWEDYPEDSQPPIGESTRSFILAELLNADQVIFKSVNTDVQHEIYSC